MNFGLFFRTVINLKPTQLFYQVKNRLIKHSYIALKAPVNKVPELNTFPIAKYHCLEGDKFTFLNLEKEFAGWNFTDNGMLWAFNQNYFDWINEERFPVEEGCKWIDLFIKELPQNRVGLEIYPIALRSINWMKFISLHKNQIDAGKLKIWHDSLYSQIRLLEQKLEYHLMGNHLLEDFYALYIASIYFQDEKMFSKYSRLLCKELDEEILKDGAHYEQSPMYHCILLDRLLDCCNFSFHNVCFKKQEKCNAFLKAKASIMLGHLASISYNDGSIPLLNDSANGIAPTVNDLFDYAKRLDITWTNQPLTACGYRKWSNNRIEVIMDVGEMTATYQAGHSHADTFNYELRIQGKPFVVDTGISTYNKIERRQYERGTMAHNTVTFQDKNSSEVWGGFRVGKRAKIKILEDRQNTIYAECCYAKGEKVKRRFSISTDGFCIVDEVNQSAVSRIHLAPDVTIKSVSKDFIVTSLGNICIEGANEIDIVPCKISKEYNQFHDSKCIEIHFNQVMSYKFNF